MVAVANQQRQVGPNKLERVGYRLLAECGVLFIPQHAIGGKFVVDAFVPHANLVIQFDGDYWHGNPAAFPEPDARQRRRIKLDASQDAYMAACGYRVLRFWEHQVNKDPATVRRTMVEAVESKKARRA